MHYVRNETQKCWFGHKRRRRNDNVDNVSNLKYEHLLKLKERKEHSQNDRWILLTSAPKVQMDEMEKQNQLNSIKAIKNDPGADSELNS